MFLFICTQRQSSMDKQILTSCLVCCLLFVSTVCLHSVTDQLQAKAKSRKQKSLAQFMKHYNLYFASFILFTVLRAMWLVCSMTTSSVSCLSTLRTCIKEQRLYVTSSALWALPAKAWTGEWHAALNVKGAHNVKSAIDGVYCWALMLHTICRTYNRIWWWNKSCVLIRSAARSTWLSRVWKLWPRSSTIPAALWRTPRHRYSKHKPAIMPLKIMWTVLSKRW